MSTEQAPPVKLAPFWRVQCGVLSVLGVVAWWQMPGGFPLSHPRFWVNEVLTLLIGALACAALISLWKGKTSWFQACIGALAAGAVGMGVCGLCLFPATTWNLKALLAIGAIVAMEALAAWRTLSKGRAKTIAWLPAAFVGLLAGVFVSWSQRGPDPSTNPRGTASEVDGWDWRLDEVPLWAKLDDRVGVDVPSGACRVFVGGNAGRRLSINIEPLLAFASRSPDRCWSILAPQAYREERASELIAAKQGKNELAFAYRGAIERRLHLKRDDASSGLFIEAFADLPTPVYSHLNSFCGMTISGHKRLTLQFSPCPSTEIEPVPFDYPRGRPMRLAYCDVDPAAPERARFHVVEAASGEKGPFHTLVEGPMVRGEALGLTLCDEGLPVCRIDVHDWCSQASIELSPTAGWGLPQNSIEFARTDNDPASQVQIWITLAGTSVGRGWDTVGHGPGVYVNRMTVTENAQ